MPATDPESQYTSSKRKRLWTAVAVALVVVVVLAIVSGAFGDFASGFRDGIGGQTRSQPAGQR